MSYKFNFWKKYFFLCYLPSPNVGLTIQMSVGQMPVGEQQIIDRNIRQIHRGRPPWMCGHYNVRATAGDKTGENTKDIHPILESIIKFLASSGIELSRRSGLEG